MLICSFNQVRCGDYSGDGHADRDSIAILCRDRRKSGATERKRRCYKGAWTGHRS
jgi:hypothetical protein